tara:strand:- start:203 stop:1015 length:813 start_codon:yes stop_codon:yes gene_type:complete
MIKHNKKRNTAFIYEALVREVVKQSINKNNVKRDITIKIIKESFSNGSQLKKELKLYKTLLETRNLNERIAEKLIFEVVKQHKTINQKQLFKEQSIVISKINKQISKSVFNNFVPNYKNLATIAQMFGNIDSPKAKVLLETKLIANLTEKKQAPEQQVKVPGLVVNTFVKRFNNTYDDLLQEQKELLSKYAMSFQDSGTEFAFYINEEINRLKSFIAESYDLEEIKEDKKLKEKLTSVSSLLEDISKEPLDKKAILQIMKIQNLAQELQS